MARICYWYGIVVKMLRKHKELKKEGTIQASIFVAAVDRAVADLKNEPDGDIKYSVIDKVYFKKEYTIVGAADTVPVSYRTARRWCSDFVYKVGLYAGYR